MGAGPLHSKIYDAVVMNDGGREGKQNADKDVVVGGCAEPYGVGVIGSHGAKVGRSYSCVQPADRKVLFNLSPSHTQAEPNGPKFSPERIPIS